MKRLLFKLASYYPWVYSFFCYHRKKERREEFEKKVLLFYQKGLSPELNPRRMKKIVKGVFELRGARKIMRYLIPLMDRPYIERSVRVEGLDHLEKILEKKRGTVLMAGHIGIPHFAFNTLRTMGYDVVLLSGVTPKEPKHSTYRYYDTPDKTIFVNDPSLSKVYKRRIVETLQAGKIIYYDADAGEGRMKETLSFLGREMNFPTGMIHLAHQAKAAVVPFIHLYRKGKITLILKEPIDHDWREGEGEYRRIVTEFAKLLEFHILKYPEQYMGIYGPTVLDHYFRSHMKNGITL